MTQDDVLFGYRLQLFDLAARTSVAHACRTFGVHRSTYYRWKRMVERHDLGEAKACKPHEPRDATAPRDVVDELDRRAVAPMQVFGHQQ